MGQCVLGRSKIEGILSYRFSCSPLATLEHMYELHPHILMNVLWVGCAHLMETDVPMAYFHPDSPVHPYHIIPL